ncbi:hypothetical protein BH23CHL5_BH23CHL5_25860 [soil metagenome]
MKRFHHVGLTTHDVQPDEDYVSPSKCWVTNPNDHPYRVELLRYAPESEVPADFQNSPHIAYAVDELESHLEGKEIILEPFDVDDPPFARVAFTMEDGLYVEYMKFVPGRTWFAGK